MRATNHEAVHLRDEGLIRLPDPKIAAKAVAEGRIVLTFDLDFGDILATAGSEGPSVVIFRLRDQTPAAVNPRLFRVIAECAENSRAGRSLSSKTNDFASGGYRYGPDSERSGTATPLRTARSRLMGTDPANVLVGGDTCAICAHSTFACDSTKAAWASF